MTAPVTVRRGMARAVLLALVLGQAACATPATDNADEVTLEDGTPALVWGEGEYGVVLVTDTDEEPADWEPVIAAIAANRMVVVAPDASDQDPETLVAAAAWLTDDGIERVAYLGSGSGGTSIAAAAGAGAAVDQLILVSGALTDEALDGLGEPPKLFVAAEDDDAGATEASRLTDGAAGTWNALLLVSGSEQGAAILGGAGGDALIEGVVARLEERR